MDSLDYAQELRKISEKQLESAFSYQKERALYAEALNALIKLIYITGLHKNKASFENKLSMLLATDQVEVAQEFIEQFISAKSNYKAWEMVNESYKTQITTIQSIIKYNLQGEINTNLAIRNERM